MIYVKNHEIFRYESFALLHHVGPVTDVLRCGEWREIAYFLHEEICYGLCRFHWKKNAFQRDDLSMHKNGLGHVSPKKWNEHKVESLALSLIYLNAKIDCDK